MSRAEDAAGGRMLGGQTTGSELADQGPTLVESYRAVTNCTSDQWDELDWNAVIETDTPEEAEDAIMAIPCSAAAGIGGKEWEQIVESYAVAGGSLDILCQWCITDPDEQRVDLERAENLYNAFYGTSGSMTKKTLFWYAYQYGWRGGGSNRKRSGARTKPRDEHEPDLLGGAVGRKPTSQEIEQAIKEIDFELGISPSEQAATYLETLFSPDDLVCIVRRGTPSKKWQGKFDPGEVGAFHRCGDLVARLREGVGNMDGGEAGVWICVNATDGINRSYSKANGFHIVGFANALVECDEGDLATQLAWYRSLNLPVRCVVYSGGKSLHAIVAIDASDHETYAKRVRALFSYIERSGLVMDQQNKNCGRLTRLPGPMRDNVLQKLVVAEPFGPATWEEFETLVKVGKDTKDDEDGKADADVGGSTQRAKSRLPHYLPDADKVIAQIGEAGVADMNGMGDFKFYLKLCFWCDRNQQLIINVAKQLGRIKGDEIPADLKKAYNWHAKHQADCFEWGRFRYRRLSEKGYPTQTVLHNRLGRDIIAEEYGCTINGAPAVWLGRRWGVGNDYVRRSCTARLDDINSAAVKETTLYVISQSKPRSTQDFDGRPYVSFSNGKVVDLITMKEVEPRPDMLITNTVAASWDPDAPEGEADSFLRDLADGDEAVFTVLCEIIGASLTAYPVTTQIAFLIGRANNPGTTDGTANTGKSTFEDVVSDLVGESNRSGMCPTDFDKRFDASGLVGKLVVTGDDISDMTLSKNAQSMLKRVATHNTVHAEAKYEAAFDFQPNCNLMFSMNNLPRMAGVDSGFVRRVSIVPFRHMFVPGEDERQDIRRVMAEPGNQARLAFLGAQAAHQMIAERRTRYSSIDGMDEELNNLIIESDNVRAWIDDQGITREFIDHRRTHDIFELFKEWADDLNQQKTSSIEFSRRMCRIFNMRTTNSNDRITKKKGNVFVPIG